MDSEADWSGASAPRRSSTVAEANDPGLHGVARAETFRRRGTLPAGGRPRCLGLQRESATTQSSLPRGASRAPRGDSGIGREVPHPGPGEAPMELGSANDASGIAPPVDGSAP
jgi:hypothetical protein